jgi:ribonuclease HI
VPWVRALLRGQKIYARATDTGALLAEGGRVEIRYKPNDGRRYQARADNLQVVPGAPLPDETCGVAQAVEKAEGAADAGAGPSSKGSGGGPRSSSRGRARGGREATAGVIPEGTILCYADGACSGNPGPAGLGVVIIDGDTRVELSEYLGNGTNNVAELTAVLRALEEVSDRGRPMVIHTDSQYTIGVVQKGWKAKANVELVAELREALEEREDTRLHYVPGHSGVVLNERADALAREAVKERKTRRAVIPKRPA